MTTRLRNESPRPRNYTYNLTLRSLQVRLYTSHFLSTWNSRLFEFGAVLFLVSIYPATLLPMSVYALARNGRVIIFSPAVGSWIDQGNRLIVVRVSIIGPRLTVAASCVVILACMDKLCAVINIVAVERDWVVVIAEDNKAARRIMNARMRRIDLFCKLLGPLAISLINGASPIAAIWVTLGMNTLSISIEYICITRVFKMVPALQRPPTITDPEASGRDVGMPSSQYATGGRISCVKIPVVLLPTFCFSPSFSLSVLYFTILSFSGQMIAFLLFSGYDSIHVGITRTVSTILELSATWIASILTKKIGPVRGGIWFLCWQIAWLALGVIWFFGEDQGGRRVLAASGLVAGVVLSRIGLWGFDLCAQIIVQAEVDEDHRGAFSSLEASFQNLFELLSYAMTIIFSRPE
ncbi:hypothetical protein M501DRAFT_1024162 [Patellaria atrata CBS 101060]|uniref:Solute carrier family 40 member n=1 Tax=Patellaria atrata CBS 101060 TaxID=1346257 RepID=A0A9P4SAN8_9PEZI|nr:hypothetical protein M501DRAFT_1024162 [Patellaria atrata CBS 101060]